MTMERVIKRRTVNICFDISGRVSASPGPPIMDRFPATPPPPSPPPRDMPQPPPRAPSRNYDFVEDAMYALEKDCVKTAEVLKRKMPKQKPPPKPMEVEYKLRFTPPPPEFNKAPFEQEPLDEDIISDNYGVQVPESEGDTTSLKRRARSATPLSQRLVRIEKTPEPSALPICVSCTNPIKGKCVTALGPNSEFASKFHPECFVCTYCTRALNTRGTYKEHDAKPYCHECFYRLYSGLIYAFDEQNRVL